MREPEDVEFVGGPLDGQLCKVTGPEFVIQRMTSMPPGPAADLPPDASPTMVVGVYRRSRKPPVFGDPWAYIWMGEKEQ